VRVVGAGEKITSARGTGGSGRSYVPRSHVLLWTWTNGCATGSPRCALRFSATSAKVRRPPSSRRAAFFVLLRYPAWPPLRPLPNLSPATPHRPRPRCASPLPCRAFLTPGASSSLLPFRRREYQSISASGVSRARSLDKNPPAFFPRGTAPAGGEGTGRGSLASRVLVALDGAATPASSHGRT
jgi:hypothetical protein